MGFFAISSVSVVFPQTQKKEIIDNLLTCKGILFFITQGRTCEPAEFQQEKMSQYDTLELLNRKTWAGGGKWGVCVCKNNVYMLIWDTSE